MPDYYCNSILHILYIYINIKLNCTNISFHFINLYFSNQISFILHIINHH